MRTDRTLQLRPRSLLAAGALGVLAHASLAQTPVSTFIAEQPISLPPQDVAITPNGNLAVVRSAGPTGAFSVPTTSEVTVWRVPNGVQFPIQSCGTELGRGKITTGYSSDGIAITNDVAVTIGSSATTAGPETKTHIDVIRLSGGPPRCAGSFTINNFSSGDHGGLASDVAISPNGSQAIVNHRNWVSFLNLTVEPATHVGVNIGNCYPGPQSDSVAITDTRAVAVTTRDVGGVPHAWVYIFDITTPGVVQFLAIEEIGGLEEAVTPHDVAITPDGTKAVVTCNDRFVLFDLATGARTDGPVASGQTRQYGAPAVPVDSVELTDDRAVLLSQSLATGDWVVDIYDISPSLQFVAQFQGNGEGFQPHDLAVREMGPVAFASVRAGLANLSGTASDGIDLVISGLEAGGTPQLHSFPAIGTPFAHSGVVFCSDSTEIAGVGLAGSPITLYAVSLGTIDWPPPQMRGYLRAIDLRQSPPVAQYLPIYDAAGVHDSVAVDLAVSHGGKDVAVRSFAPPSDPNPALDGRDLARIHIDGFSPPIYEAARFGGIGESNDLRMMAVDSVVSAGDYTVSIAELTTGPNKGYVHFVKTGF